jgi:hypothetical protein
MIPAESNATTGGRRPGIPRGTRLLLVGLALVFVMGSAGFLYTTIAKQRTIDSAHATATAHAAATAHTMLTGTHAAATATYQAINAVIATVQAQATTTAIAATAIATALQNIYIQATRGRPVLDDPLGDNSKGYGWTTSSFTGFPCEFTAGAYHVKSPTQSYYTLCVAQNTDYSNFAFQIQMTIIAGDTGGIAFRADGANTRLYLFGIQSDGTYALDLDAGSSVSQARRLALGSSSAINSGLNRPNLITVVARGSSIDIYVNQQYVTGGNDSTYSHGQIGVMAYAYMGNPTEVAFSNAKVWTL